MSETTNTAAVPGGTAKGYSVVGRKLLTVTATSAHSDDSLIESLLTTIFPTLSLNPGETLAEFAERVAEGAGLTVANWEFSAG